MIRALQGRLLSNLLPSPAIPSPLRAPWADFPRVELHSLPSMASRQTTSFSMPAQRTPIFMCRQKGSSGNTSSCSPVFGKPIPTHRQLRHIDFGCRSRDSGLPLLSCAAFGPLQPGHPLCRGAGRLSAGGLGRYAFPLRCPGRIPSQWNWHGTAGQALAPRNGSFLIGQKLFLILYSFFHFSLR